MTTLTVQEAQGQLAKLIAQAYEGEAVVLTDGDKRVTLEPRLPFDPEEDSPELEAELLKGIDGPYDPYSEQGLRRTADRILAEHRARQRQ